MDSVTSTAGSLTNTTACIKDHLLISREQLQEEKKKRLTDQATVINTMEHLHASQEREKDHVSSIHTHTQIFSNTLV